MEAGIERKQTTFRLSTELLARLKEEARKENRSLNSYVESLLMDIVYKKPNKQPIDAIKEALESQKLEVLDVRNLIEVVI